jgi:hypothetical protein
MTTQPTDSNASGDRRWYERVPWAGLGTFLTALAGVVKAFWK